MVDRRKGHLFSSRELREIIESNIRAARTEVETLDANRLLNTAPADLVKYLVGKYELTAPELKREALSAAEQEIQIDVRHDRTRHVMDRSRPALIPGQRIDIEVPVEGESYRIKEAKARTELKAAQRRTARAKAGKS